MQPDQQRSPIHQPPLFQVGMASVVLLVSLLAAASEVSIYAAKRAASSAQALAGVRGEREQVLALTGRALALNPSDPQALYLRAVTLKEGAPSVQFDRVLAAALEVHPNQAAVRRIAGEVAFSNGDSGAAAEYLTEALWINPTPPSSPAAFWRMAMVACHASGRSDDALRAATRALALMDSDPFLHPSDRRDLALDAARVFRARGAEATAAHLEEIARGMMER